VTVVRRGLVSTIIGGPFKCDSVHQRFRVGRLFALADLRISGAASGTDLGSRRRQRGMLTAMLPEFRGAAGVPAPIRWIPLTAQVRTSEHRDLLRRDRFAGRPVVLFVSTAVGWTHRAPSRPLYDERMWQGLLLWRRLPLRRAQAQALHWHRWCRGGDSRLAYTSSPGEPARDPARSPWLPRAPLDPATAAGPGRVIDPYTSG